jgi:hypothetical protein
MLSQDQVTAIYCIVDDVLKLSDHRFDTRAKLSDSEVITLGIVSALNFGGVYIDGWRFLRGYRFFTQDLSPGRLSRRMARLAPILDELITGIGRCFTDISATKEFLLDSTTLEVCHNIRILRCRILKGEEFRGYKASFRTYFYGLRLQLLTTKEGIPVEYFISEASLHDTDGMKEMEIEITPESKVYADAAYTDYAFEDEIREISGIEWLPQRKINAKRQHQKSLRNTISKARKRIETVFSQIKDMFKRKIHAVTIEGYMLKIKYFLLAYQLKLIL